MSPVSTQYSSTMSGLEAYFKDTIDKGGSVAGLVSLTPIGTLAAIAGVQLATWAGPAAAIGIVAAIRAGINNQNK